MDQEQTIQVVHDRRALSRVLAEETQIGLVQTAGSLHEGHLALIRAARQKARFVVVSISPYRTELVSESDTDLVSALDQQLAQEAGADLIFAPSFDMLYPFGQPQITLDPGPVGTVYEGAQETEKFGPKLAETLKLINLVQPEQIYLGQRDAQLLTLVRQMVRDLDLPVTVETVPIYQDLDGLATARVNETLSDEAREIARQLSVALYAGVQQAAESGSASKVLETCQAHLAQYPELVVEYLDLVDPMSFQPWTGSGSATALLIAAVRLGEARLIDNQLVVLGRN